MSAFTGNDQGPCSSGAHSIRSLPTPIPWASAYMCVDCGKVWGGPKTLKSQIDALEVRLHRWDGPYAYPE